jgi:hypothetical protein
VSTKPMNDDDYRYAYELTGKFYADRPRCVRCKHFSTAGRGFCDLHLEKTTPRAACRKHSALVVGGGA